MPIEEPTRLTITTGSIRRGRFATRVGLDREPLAPGGSKALAAQLGQLCWWSDALRAHRDRVPYVTGA